MLVVALPTQHVLSWPQREHELGEPRASAASLTMPEPGKEWKLHPKLPPGGQEWIRKEVRCWKDRGVGWRWDGVEDQQCQVVLGYTASLRPAWATQGTAISKTLKNEEEEEEEKKS